MFDWLFKKNKNDEYVSCEWLEYGVNFGAIGIHHCCQFSHSDKNDKPVSSLNSKNQYCIREFFKQKNKVRKQHKKGKINERCIGCFDLKKQVWEDKNKITRMAIGPNTKCNASCIYCYTSYKKDFYNSKKDIPILYILKNFVENNFIDKECEITFNNGEPLIMDEFEDIVNLFVDNNVGKLRVHSSGIKYSTAVRRALESGRCDFIVSPDSGNKELYKKIKRIDAFDKVVENIKEYAKIQPTQANVQLKYIIIPTVNDTFDALKEFIDIAKECGVYRILLDIELWWYRKNSKNNTRIRKIFELAKQAKCYMEERGIVLLPSIIFDEASSSHKDIYDEVMMN